MLLHPVKRIQDIFGICTNERHMTDLVTAVVRLQGVPLRAVKKRRLTRGEVLLVLGANVSHELGVLGVGGLFINGLHDCVLERLGHWQPLLTLWVRRVKGAGATQRVAADDGHLFQHNDFVLATFERRDGCGQTGTSRANNDEVIGLVLRSGELRTLGGHLTLQCRHVNATLCKCIGHSLFKGCARYRCARDRVNVQSLILQNVALE